MCLSAFLPHIRAAKSRNADKREGFYGWIRLFCHYCVASLSLHFGNTIPLHCQWRGFNEITLVIAKQVEKNIWTVLEHFDIRCVFHLQGLRDIWQSFAGYQNARGCIGNLRVIIIKHTEYSLSLCCLYRNVFLCQITIAIADMINHMSVSFCWKKAASWENQTLESVLLFKRG